MAQNDKNLQGVYNTLKKEGYNPPAYDEFVKDMQDDKNLQGVRNTLVKHGYTPPEFSEFKSDMFGAPAVDVQESASAAEGPRQPMLNPEVAAEMEGRPLEGGWQPTVEQYVSGMEAVRQGYDAAKRSMDVREAAFGHMVELNTAEGQRKVRDARERAMMHGVAGEVVGARRHAAKAENDTEGGAVVEQPAEVAVTPNNVVARDVKLNQQTGQWETVWQLPDGSLTTNQLEAERWQGDVNRIVDQRRKAEQAADMSVGAQIRRAEAELAELRKQLDESASRVHREWAEDYEKNDAPLAAVFAANTYVPRQTADKENSALRVAIRQREEQLKNLYEERDRQIGKDVGFWRGFGRTVSDVRTWDFGTGDLLDAMTMLNADKYAAPDATEGEKRAGQEMLKAIYDNQQVEEMYGGNASFWNRAGVMTGYMPSFMLDFALTGGGYKAINVAGKAAARGSVKLIGEAAIKEMTELGVKAYAKKYGIRGVGRMAENWTIKALGTTADDLLIRAPLMTNTVQAGKTTADIIDRKLGNVVVDGNGNYDFSNDETWGSAIWQGEANAIIENYSEMFGAHLDSVVPALAKTFGGKRISGMLARANASGFGKILETTRKRFQSLGVSDYFGEVSEEYYGQLWRTMLNLDDAYTNVPVYDEQGNQVLDAQGNPVYERKNLLFTGKFHGDIWGGMALSMGLMGFSKYTMAGAAYGGQRMISGMAYANMKHQVNVADRVAAEIFTPERWEPIREIIDNTTNDDIGTLAESMVNDPNLSDEERAAVMEYMERSLNLRGLNLGAMAQSRGAEDEEGVELPTPVELDMDNEFSQSYIDGYEASSPQEMADAQNMYEYQRQRAEGMFEPSVLESLDGNPVATLMDMSQTGLYSQEEIDAARDYINAKTVRDGILQRVNDNIDEQIAQSDAMINARVNPASGMIQPAIMGLDDRQVYVVGGSLAINPDGTIDREASDESIVVRDAVTGEVEFADPKSIVSAGEAIDPEMEKAMAVDNIRQQAAQAAADALNGVLPLNPGDVVPIIAGGSPTTFTIVGPAIDEQTQSPIPDTFVVEWLNGIQTSLTREQIQAYADEEAIARLNNFEQQRGAERAQQHATEAEALRPQFALNDEFTILNDNGTPIRGSITAELDEDGIVEIHTEEPINGNHVNRFTPAELEEMFDTYNGQPVNIPVPETEETVPNIEENPNIAGQKSENSTETVPNPEETVEIEAQQSALSRVPVDEQGQPKYEEADPDTAWYAIVEQAQGDEATAAEVVADIVAERQDDFNAAEKALSKTKEGKPEKRKKGDPAPTMAERIAAKNAAKEALAEAQAIRDRAKAALDHWKSIAGTKQRRENERRSAEDAEARRRAAERAAEEARLRAEREEAERIEREALNGVPDWNVDTPADARARGYRRNGPQKVDRPEIIDNHAIGNSVEVKFGDDVMPTGNIAIIEASQLQPSHRDGQRNPYHFLDEAQPKERKDAASRFAAAKIAEGMRPEEITSSVTAFTGAPSINARGEVIQGNNRSEALRLMYENYAQSAESYKQYLIDHAAEFGLTPEAIEAFEQPVLVNMLDVSDENAITLGQYVAQDTESGGIERIKPRNAVQKMGDKIRTFANLLLRSADDEATFAQLVDANGINVLKWMNQQGYITNTQYASAFDSKGNLTAEAANDLKGIMYQSIFTGGSTRLEEMFNKMPAKAQRAILATAFRDHDSAYADRMISEIQQSIIAFDALMSFKQFHDASNAEATQNAVEAWKKQFAFDDVSGEPYLPSETFSNFALALAAMYKGNTQKHIQSVFNMMYDIVQGTEQDNLFEAADKTPKPLAEAIRRVLNLEYQPIVNPTTDNGTNGSTVLDVDSEDGQDGRPGSSGNTDGAEQNPQAAEPADGGTGTASDSGQGGEVATEEATDNATEQHNFDDLDDSALAERIDVADDDWTEGEGQTPTYKRTITIDGKHKVIQIDEPDGNGFYTGSRFEYQGENFGILTEVIDLIDGNTVCPVCGKRHIPNYKNQDVVCPQCGTDLSVFRQIDQLSDEEAANVANNLGLFNEDGTPKSLQELVKAAEAEVNTDPTEAQKEAHEVDDGGLDKIKRQAEREDGQLLILPSEATEEAGALSGPTFDSPSDGKDSVLPSDKQENSSESLADADGARARAPQGTKPTDGAGEQRIEDFGEKLAGARKDALREVAKSIENVSVQSLVELPISKAFKRPNLKKMVESGAISDEDAVMAEAIMQGIVYAQRKPVLTRRQSSKKEIAAWAEKTYKGIELLGEILSGDESRKSAALASYRSELEAERERANEFVARLREYNPGRVYGDVTEMPDGVSVTARVLAGIGHRPGEKVVLPLTRVSLSSTMQSYDVEAAGKQGALWFKRRHDTLDEAIETMVLAAKLARGDKDVELPQAHFGVQGVGTRHSEPTGKFVVAYMQGNRYNVTTKTFDSEVEAEAFAKEKGGRVHAEQRYTSDYDGYVNTVVNPLTGNKHVIGETFGSRVEAVAWLDENHDEVNRLALEAISNEMGTKGEKRAHFYVTSSCSRNAGKVVYSVVEDNKASAWPFVQDFDSRKEAEEWLAMNLERLEQERKARRDRERSIVYYNTKGERSGADFRNGQDASPEMFGEAFGFRGVQFGNWTNDADRQAALNEAYDALHDMAAALGISPRAVSLDGELGLAFGARGTGRAAAHYEPVEVVINLTKTQGAGALAHEWWHALDNYLSRRAGISMGYASERHGIEKMHPEVSAALDGLMSAISGSDYAKRSADKGDYWGRRTEVMARLFETWIAERLRGNGQSSPFLAPGASESAQRLYQRFNYVAYSANERRVAKREGREPAIMSEDEFYKTPQSLSGYPYPTREEVAEFDSRLGAFFGALAAREVSSGSMAEERGGRYGRRNVTNAGLNLFDWADAEERLRRRGTEPTEESRAAEDANAALDSYAASYMEYLERSEGLDAELSKTDAESTEGRELQERLAHEEALLLEQRGLLEDALREYYARENTPEDAARIARDMVWRVQAEVEVRRNRRQLLSDVLADNDVEGQLESAPTVSEGVSVKSAGGRISYSAQGHLPDAAAGEFAYVERQFSRTGEFGFTGNSVIRDRGDVAYMFRALEDYSIEHVFAVFVKDGRANVLHIGMGGPTSSFADMGAVRAGVDAFGADAIYLVHNHPSGYLVSSHPDRALMKTLETAFGDKVPVEGIIIDTTSGRYTVFDSQSDRGSFDRDRSGADSAVDVMQFDRVERHGGGSERIAIANSDDVARYVAERRLGGGDKVSYLILSNRNEVVGNFHTGYSSIDEPGLAEELASVATKYGGTRVIVYGNTTVKGASALGDAVKRHSAGGIRLLDAMAIDDRRVVSANDEGYLQDEGATTYGVADAGAMSGTDQLKRDSVALERMPAGMRSAAEAYLAEYPSAPLVMVRDEADVDSLELPESAKRALLAVMNEADTMGGYCRYDGKIYIFAGHGAENEIPKTLLHENVHGVFGILGAKADEFADVFASKVSKLPNADGFMGKLYEALSDGYAGDRVNEEFLAYVLCFAHEHKSMRKAIVRPLSESEKEFFQNEILNRLYGTDKESGLDRGWHASSVHEGEQKDNGRPGDGGEQVRAGRAAGGVDVSADDDVVYRTSSEIDNEYPNWLDGTTTESGKHSTQVEGTRKTYGKVGDWIESNLGKDVAILDASSGMGYGTADLRERGFNIEDVEPYQSEQRKANNPATYDSYGKIDKQYDYIISNAVLNVIPDDWRRDVLHDMASRLKAGGRLFINTRKAGEEKGIKDKIELDSPREVLVKRNGKIASYQRFFTPKELKEWVESELGGEYAVEIANERNSGTKGLAAVVVTRNETVNRQGDGYGAYSDAEVSFANDPVSKVMGKNRFSKKRQAEFAARERQRMVTRIQELAERMRLDNVEIITDASQLEGKRAKAKGFYNKRTRKITIVIPNNVSTIDAEQTLLHEAVAHYGLRQLFGEQFNTFLDNVYESADESIRRKIAEMAAQNGWDFRTATEEYLAGLAEDTNFSEAQSYTGWWSKIKRLFLDMLESIGFEGFRDKVGVVLTDNELRYILWRSYENLAEPGRYRSILSEAADVAKQSDLKVGNYAEQGVEAEYAAEGDLYRSGDFSPRDRVFARYAYESMVRSGGYQFKEAVQDSMLGLKKLYQAILGRKTRIEDVPGFENAYLFENRMSSMNAGEQHEYFQRYMQPLLQEIGRIAGANKRKRRELTDYIMAKHGLERNEYMRNEAAANGEDTDRDFAGLLGLTGEADWQAAEDTARQWVDDYEAMYDTAALWEAINKATKATLEKVYLSGIISKDTYEKILGMYDYYVPLRGWNEKTSDEVYGYLTSKDGPLGGSIMKKAEGRESMADDPIATIGMMADDAIRQGNRNLMKQRFLNFILNHPSDAVSVHDLWLEYNDVTDEWVPVFADVEETDTADVVEQKVKDFEERMEALRTAEPGKYKRGREAQHIPYKVVRGNLREHQILIKRNGRTFVATINGNPRAAQAINGLTNPDVDQNGVVGNMLKAGTWVNRQLSAFYTTRNPDFVVGNFFRDMLYSNCMTWVKESPRYARRFHKNFARVNPLVMRRLLGKWEKGTLNMSNRIESLFYQFMKNGGETGYTNVRDIEGHKRAIAAELKKQGSTGRRVWTALGMQLDLLNRAAENCARFAAFVTSRDFGRNIDRAIYDAKEISVNFNKKGSGGKMVNATGQTKLGKTGAYLSGGGRLLYVFWNAGVQGMTNFGRQAKLHPAKFSVGATALFTLGYVIPMLAQMLGGGDGDDDDKNAYYNLPEYVRRSNICFYAGDQWITIPLPIEYRAMYGMGELAHGVISGNERYSNTELARQMASQVSQIFPIDMLEGGGGVSPFIPSAAKPFTEAYIMNKGWTGLPVYKDTPFNKNMPEWTKAYASADKHLVDFAKWLNETSGGDDFKKGSIDINPAKIEYLLNGTFGGLFTFPNKLKKSAETAFGDRDFEWRNMPIANRLIKSGDERTAYRKLQNEYFKYQEEYKETGRLMRKYENADADGIFRYAEKIAFMELSPEYARWEIFDTYKADIDAYREMIATETNAENRVQLEAEMYAEMRELVNALHNPDDYFKDAADNQK
ncbi:MAG: methyltransferase domain-containing protein [Paramuribaculum sp.]|nr:methyltransferase domain-containing protein [Paramuribaculum sp.]